MNCGSRISGGHQAVACSRRESLREELAVMEVIVELAMVGGLLAMMAYVLLTLIAA